MAAQAKPKHIRLIDVLNTINENEYILVTLNNGRNTFSHSVHRMEAVLKDYLTSEIKALTVNCGVIQIFI